MISAIAWIPRGASKARPARYEVGPEEYSRIKELAQGEMAMMSSQPSAEDEENITNDEVADEEGMNVPELPLDLKMDGYDEEYETLPLGNAPTAEEDGEGEMFELLKYGERALALDAESDDSDVEDDEIKPSDTMLVIASTEDEYSHLEVHLYSEDGSFYTHHDITLKDFPLSLAWLDCPPFLEEDGQKGVGSYIAVGSFEPAIEIWNLDVLDPLEPSAVLGGRDREKERERERERGRGVKKSKGKKSKKERERERLHPDSHQEAVMALHWNTTFRHTLASSSADTTVKVWDVTTQQCQLTYTEHTDKVQCIQFHPTEPWVLASAAFDRTLRLRDCRISPSLSLSSSSPSPSLSLSQLPADPECLKWDPFHPFHIYCSLESGQVVCYDVRNLSLSLSLFQAHEASVTSLSFSPEIPGYLVTASVDKTVKVWDVLSRVNNDEREREKERPEMIMYKTMNVGKLFAMDFYRDLLRGEREREREGEREGYLLACAGDGGTIAIWESDESERVKEHFKERERERERERTEGNIVGERERNVVIESEEKEREMEVVGVEETKEERERERERDGEKKKKKKKKKKASGERERESV
eukprot:CAMPEP_0182417104 /NCGR_PEP_ID=MMETSP1167-20130531/1486_1 /TAXON_ID=2988 /ORGANISM="Mallomonas Sp, Strain CCMP3275" /LENGTH=588 /DNA_ID=CAMNT_0024590411 /DNA_START=169 /DNA_END=1935 /DNA_ORIENTATION=-